jgi:hypothetical protein
MIRVTTNKASIESIFQQDPTYPTEHVFSHGQFYVAISRAKDSNRITTLTRKRQRCHDYACMKNQKFIAHSSNIGMPNQ